MTTFEDFKLAKHLRYALDDMGLTHPTPIQQQSYSLALSGKNIVGISQTGTGKTIAFCLPILQDMKYLEQSIPRVLIIVPTRELVVQVVETLQALSSYQSVRIVGVYGGTNINNNKMAVAQGVDILVGTPGRLYDIVLHGVLKLHGIKKLVIDEVDLMLDLGFRFQLNNILELLPERRQNIMYSATMTDEVETLINDFILAPQKISIAVSGTPLQNIEQISYKVENFYTKANLIAHLVKDKDRYGKVLIFTSTKKNADRLYEYLEPRFGKELDVIHANKSQNRRLRAIEEFDTGKHRILISTDLMARGIDLTKITHVINTDVPEYPENYLHRIGRTGRAEEKGHSIQLYTAQEEEQKIAIEVLMNYEIPDVDFPDTVEISEELTPEERAPTGATKNHNRHTQDNPSGPAFHEKKAKNQKVNQGGKYRRELAKKYKKPKTRGDKIQNLRKKKKK